MFNVLVIVSLVLSVLSLMVNAAVLAGIFVVYERAKHILTYVDSIERYCAGMAGGAGMEGESGFEGEYRTEDGKYRAPTMEGLLRQIMKSRGPHTPQSSEEFIKDINSETPWVDSEELDEQNDEEDPPFM